MSARNPHERGRQLTSEGTGPVFQRDYWAELDRCDLPPTGFGDVLAAELSEFLPEALACFRREGNAAQPLEKGDDLRVWIRFAGECGVRVIHKDRNSITLATLHGHPEAGRITFGAYRNDRGNVVFHIRSRARAATRPLYVGFLAGGQSLQAATWTVFVEKVASAVARGVEGCVHEETRAVPLEGHDDEDEPTFVARGD